MPETVVVGIFSVVAVAIGYVLKPLGDLITYEWHGRRDDAEKRKALRRETLTELQDAMVEAVDKSDLVAKGVNQNYSDAQSASLHAGALAARLDDDDLRERVREFRSAVARVLELRRTASDADIAEMRAGFEAANDRLGIVFRQP